MVTSVQRITSVGQHNFQLGLGVTGLASLVQEGYSFYSQFIAYFAGFSLLKDAVDGEIHFSEILLVAFIVSKLMNSTNTVVSEYKYAFGTYIQINNKLKTQFK